MPEENRDHLFISYAGEDGAFAEWLTLRLTAEGYKVWCDRIKLLGGESYPRDIDEAIKNQTFRMLAVLSRNSIQKANPVKERTLALNLARQRGEEFIIPLNLDGLDPTEIDWMMSDITFVPFHQSWAEGLARILKLLESLGAPKTLSNGRKAVCDWVAAQDFMRPQPEQLWTNVLDVKELPETLLRVNARRGSLESAFGDWPRYRENDQVCWAFELPPNIETLDRADIRAIHWNEMLGGSRLSLRNVRVNLLRQYVHLYCTRRGLQEIEGERRRHHLYFSAETTTNGRLPFHGYNGRVNHLRAVGERNFWIGPDQRETIRYHLSPTFSPQLDVFANPVVSVRLRVHLTYENGQTLPVRRAVARRKAICKRWFNHEWLTRLLAVIQWLSNGQSEINLALTDSTRIVLSAKPRACTVPLGINEELLEPIPESDDDGDISDFENIDEEDEQDE